MSFMRALASRCKRSRASRLIAMIGNDWVGLAVCTAPKNVLNQPADFRKQVIVNELLHLRVPNNGKLFKALLRACLGKEVLV
jgi:hypothetical protein